MKNILIVEDEILIAKRIKKTLESNNYNCIGISVDYSGAIEILENFPVDFVLLDIRTAEELAENGTMEGAMNVDYYSANFQDEIAKLNKDEAVYLYCRSGGRSGGSMRNCNDATLHLHAKSRQRVHRPAFL